MIRIEIGGNGSERTLEEASESWINQQINRRRRDGVPVCVRVYIKEGELDVVLATSDCRSMGGGTRRPKPAEAEIFRLWDSLGLKDPNFASGQLIAFLKRLR